MYTYEYRFFPKRGAAEESEYIKEIENFISCLVVNGQLIECPNDVIAQNDYLSCRVLAQDKRALNPENHNVYVKKLYRALQEQSDKETELIPIGREANGNGICECNHISRYILKENYASSPILCDSCKKRIPLYKMPKTYRNEDYYDILNWQRMYSALDDLFTEGTYEQYAYKELSTLSSPLTIEGRRICAFLEKELNRPFYYYLFNYAEKRVHNCPGCGKEWAAPLANDIWDYICDDCRLISYAIGLEE